MTNWLKSEFAWSCLIGALMLSSPLAAQASRRRRCSSIETLTPAAGATDVLALRRLLASFEDRVLPADFRKRRRQDTRSASVSRRQVGGHRLAAGQLSDGGRAKMLGHGARLREIGASGVRYQFDAPPPYGDGSAATFVDSAWPHTTRADLLAIDAAGIETQNVLADDIGEQALARDSLSYRDAWLYAQSRIAGLLYIRSVSPQSEPGHDVAQFLNHLNDGCVPPVCTPLEMQTLKQHALLMLVDPMLAFSAYEFAAAYLVRGQTAMTVPMIPLGHGIRYLPAVGFAMTARHGVDDGALHSEQDRLTKFSVRIGDTGACGRGRRRSSRSRRNGRIAVDLSADI